MQSQTFNTKVNKNVNWNVKETYFNLDIIDIAAFDWIKCTLSWSRLVQTRHHPLFILRWNKQKQSFANVLQNSISVGVSSEAVARGCFSKKVFLKISQYSQKNTCVRVSFSQAKAYNFNKRRLLHRCFPVNIAKFLGAALFREHLWWLLLYLFNKVASLKSSNVIKKRLQHRCFTVKFAKVLRTAFLTEHLRWLLLKKFRRSLWFIVWRSDALVI